MRCLVRSWLALSAVVFLAPVHGAQGKVWVIDNAPGPGIDFTSLAAGVAAASDGDVLLLKQGMYSSLSITGKALTVQADENFVTIDGTASSIQGLSAAQSVHVRGVRWLDPLTLSANAGVVWVEDVRGPGRFGPISADDCSSVVLLRMLPIGTVGYSIFDCSVYVPSEAALQLEDSSIHAFGSTFTGGRGGSCYVGGICSETGQPGAPGIDLTGPGFLFLSDSDSIGGLAGCIGEPLGCPKPECSQGGAGLANGGEVRLIDSSLLGAPSVSYYDVTSTPGPSTTGADPVPLPGKALRFEASSPVREGESVALSFEGPPWTPVYLATGSGPNAHFVENVRGTVLVSELAQIEFVGFTGADGTLETTRDLSDLPDGVDSTLVFYQALYVTAAPAAASMLHDLVRRLPRFVLGAGSMVVQLDEQF